MRRTATLFLLVALSLSPLRAAEPLPLDQALASEAAKLTNGRVVWATWKGDATRFGAFAPQGAASVAKPEQQLFEIGSVSKVFTGLLLAQAVIEKKVTLDTTLGALLKLEGLDPRVAKITLRQLSTHTSCLPRLPDNLGEDAVDPYGAYDRSRLDAYLLSAKLTADPPCPQSYSNLAAGLLGDLLARSYDTDYETLLRQKITGPLGLTDTTITLNESQRARFEPGFEASDKRAPWTFKALAGAGAIRSTAADMIRFSQQLADPKCPIADAWAMAREVQPTTGGNPIGLGVFVLQRDGATRYAHDGGTGGYRTLWWFDPIKRESELVLTSNAAFEPAVAIGAARNPGPKDRVENERLEVTALPQYLGVYDAAKGSAFTIISADGRLWTKLTGQGFLPLYRAKGDRFFTKAVAAEIEFGRDSAGKIDRLTLFQNGNEMKAKRTSSAAPPFLLPRAEALKPYLGRYVLMPGVEFTITLRSETLLAQLTGQSAVPVFNTGPDRFVYDVVEAQLDFERDEAGKVIAVVLHQNGVDQRAKRIAD